MAEDRKEAGVALLKDYDRIYQLQRVHTVPFTQSRKFTDLDRETFFRQMGLLLKSQIPILKVLHIMGGRHNAKMAALCRVMAGELSRGMDLSQSLERHQEAVGNLAYRLMAAGEKSGQMVPILESLAASYHHKREARKFLMGACLYPVLVLFIGSGIVVYFVHNILPVFYDLYGNLHLPVPLPLQWLMKGVALFQASPLVCCSFLLIVAAAAAAGIRQRGWKCICIGPLKRLYHTYWEIRFTSLLAMLLSSGLPVHDALAEVEQIMPTKSLQAAGKRMTQAVMRGDTLARAARQNPTLCSDLTAEFIAMGEESGTLPVLLKEVSELIREDFESRLKSLKTMLEPALLLGLAGICLLMVYMVLSPMLHLMDAAPGTM
ncbi:MAG: type II secretion system F family protein [Acidaminococcus sp.]|jgi:type II secretory pathway component PulF|nr:type II secretion system F family protein [Acidaminococcus sp.]MCI2100635.1 type II secretion system F family protein [Acidaminococcus sp.]MCI2114956.1 type II secretion system F family protein [Acidaminococcus sp.]MCI2117025.1 type II secretion system F family protein [Acidaminococcus sp.]